MQKNSMAEKKQVFWDGVEIPGLVLVEEITLEKSTIEVPSFKKIRIIQSDITKIPAVNLKYRLDRGTSTLKFWEDFYYENEIHDASIIRTDASGAEFARRLLPQCECIKISEPAYDAASPTYASITVTVLPYDIIPVASE